MQYSQTRYEDSLSLGIGDTDLSLQCFLVPPTRTQGILTIGRLQGNTEDVYYTNVVANTVTIALRGLSTTALTPTQVIINRKVHNANESLEITTHHLYDANKTRVNENETVSGNWEFTGTETFADDKARSKTNAAPIDEKSFANKKYVDDQVGGVADQKFKVSSDDTTTGFAEDKITVSGGIVKTTTSPGGNEKLNFDMPKASQAEAEDGKNDDKFMTPLKTKYEINYQTEFGDGSDGDVTISSPVTLTRDMFYNNLTVNSTLTTDGYKIYVKGTISGSGIITWGVANNGGNSGSGSSGFGVGGAASGSGLFKNGAGGDGGKNWPSESGTGKSVSLEHSIGVIGGSGGSSGHPGGASTVSKLIPITTFRIGAVFGMDILINSSGLTYYPYTASGGGGGGGSSGNATYYAGGGGGGAGGGLVWIAAKIWAGTFEIKALGGNGGNGYYNGTLGGGGGGGGGGGVAVIIYAKKTWTGAYNLAGGVGGVGPGSANDGANGSTGVYYEILLHKLL